jgi:hypothetical protein
MQSKVQLPFSFYFNDSYLSQRIISCYQEVRLIKHSRFALNSFFFRANDKIWFAGGFVNCFLSKNRLFLDFFGGQFCRQNELAQIVRIIGPRN